MAHGPSQRNAFRRRRNAQTDYRRRLRLLKSGAPRAIVRVSNTQVTCALARFEEDGDEIITSFTGSRLRTHGWPENASAKSIPACYLAGYALGKQALARGHDNAVLDIGLSSSSRGSRAFAALKGMLDAGLEIPHGESVLPSEERINGEHIDGFSSEVAAVRAKIEEAFA